MSGAGAAAGGPLRALPAMHALLASPEVAPWIERLGRARVREACAAVLEEIRAARADPPDAGGVAAAVLERLEREAEPALRRVINATGVILHTGLGRAPLAQEAAAAVVAAATRYTNLEFDLEGGARGDRSALVAGHLRALTGAEAALVVNNNAAAVLLLLSALAAGREVVVSRGELVEIGGSFRIPEVMAQSGARLREVGTTNRTYARDYAAALGPETALLLKVHQSNFRIVGFTEAPSLADLVVLGARHGVPVAYDMGSGALAGAAAGEPDARAALATGVAAVTFSGDKLLGGPQAGVICGRAEVVAACARHPLQRALRVDKMTLAALEATLDLYRSGRVADVPAVAMLGRGARDLAAAAERLAAALADAVGASCAVGIEAAQSRAGAGALPEHPLPTSVVTLRPACGAETLAGALRRGRVPVVARIRADAVLLDPRALLPGDEAELPGLVAAALTGAG